MKNNFILFILFHSFSYQIKLSFLFVYDDVGGAASGVSHSKEAEKLKHNIIKRYEFIKIINIR